MLATLRNRFGDSWMVAVQVAQLIGTQLKIEADKAEHVIWKQMVVMQVSLREAYSTRQTNVSTTEIWLIQGNVRTVSGIDDQATTLRLIVTDEERDHILNEGRSLKQEIVPDTSEATGQQGRSEAAYAVHRATIRLTVPHGIMSRIGLAKLNELADDVIMGGGYAHYEAKHWSLMNVCLVRYGPDSEEVQTELARQAADLSKPTKPFMMSVQACMIAIADILDDTLAIKQTVMSS